MNDLILTSTEFTPFVFFQKSGVLLISGKVIPDSDIEFWDRISDWLSKYCQNPASKTLFRLKIDYLNTSSYKEILKILYRLEEIKDLGFFTSIEWEYVEGDQDMLEVGRDYEYLVQLPFEYIELSEVSCL